MTHIGIESKIEIGFSDSDERGNPRTVLYSVPLDLHKLHASEWLTSQYTDIVINNTSIDHDDACTYFIRKDFALLDAESETPFSEITGILVTELEIPPLGDSEHQIYANARIRKLTDDYHGIVVSLKSGMIYTPHRLRGRSLGQIFSKVEDN